MAVIEVLLRQDMQSLGYIKMRDDEPYYSYPLMEATSMTIEEAVEVIEKLSNKYFFKIHREKKDITRNMRYIIV